jgi:hypothetical protein
MAFNVEDLARQFDQLNDDALLDRWRSGTLTEAAQALADAEVRKRHLPSAAAAQSEPPQAAKTDRPRSVTVIAWLLIALGGLSLITTTVMIGNPDARALMAKSPISIPVQYAITYVSLLIMLVSGVAMLQRRNWGRYLYAVGSGLGFVIGLLTSPVKEAMIPGLVIFIIAVFFLFRPKANKYFTSAEAGPHAQAV